MDKLKAMQTFVQIVEQGSLTAAADQLNTSLPTVVRVLSALESELGARLLNRTTRKIALTMEGQQYYQRCCHILSDIVDTEEALLSQQQSVAGKISISAPMFFGQMHVMPVVNSFLAEHPEVTIQSLLLDRVVSMVDEGVDVAIRIGKLEDSSLIAIPVGHISQIVCASPDLLQQAGEPVVPEDLNNQPGVHITALNARGEWELVKAGKPVRVQLEHRLITNQAMAAIEACKNGLGFGMCLSYQAQPLIESGELVRVLTDYEPEPVAVSIVYPHAKLLSARVRLLIDYLTEKFRENL